MLLGRVQQRQRRISAICGIGHGREIALPVVPKLEGVPYILLLGMFEGSIGIVVPFTVHAHRHQFGWYGHGHPSMAHAKIDFLAFSAAVGTFTLRVVAKLHGVPHILLFWLGL